MTFYFNQYFQGGQVFQKNVYKAIACIEMKGTLAKGN